MAERLLHEAKRILDRATRLSGELEIYLQESQTTAIKVYAREIESVVTGRPRGVGVRYFVGGRQGYAYSADLSDAAVDRMFEQVAANAGAGDPDPYNGLPDPPSAYEQISGLWEPGVGATAMDRKAALALEAERVALGLPEIETVEESSYSDSESRVAIVSSRGVEACYESSFCFVYLSAHARRGEDVQTALGFTTGRGPETLDPVAAGTDAGLRAARLLGAAPCRSDHYTVVFDREVAAALVGTIAQALTAEAVQKGRSLFAERLGQRVAAEQLHLSDDGLHPEGMATAPFDDEGVAHRRTALIDGGRLQAFLHDSYTARKAGGETRSTGNAARGSYRGAPGVGTTNLVVEPGTGTLDELFARVGSGVYVVGVTGLHSGANPITGEFSVGATGHLIEGGARGRPLREITIASDMLSLLGNVSDRAGDARWVPMYGSVLTPSLAIADVTVSGT